MRRSIVVVALTGALGILLVFGTSAAQAQVPTPFKDISSAGPLEHVYLGNELSCQIDHTSDTLFQFFPPAAIPGDCGTFVALGGTLYAPDFADHPATATGAIGARTPFTAVSQSDVSGAGTSASPFTVVTTVDVGLTGLRIVQTDSYVVGEEAYRTDVQVTNTGQTTQAGVLYRAGDCFLGGSDLGFGFTETFGTRKAVGCSQNANNTPAGRIEEWVPLTGGNNFYQDRFSFVWAAIGAKTAFPDTCASCGESVDNGAGISWNFAIPGSGGSATFSHITTFSPTGKEALQTTKVADSPTSTAGGPNGYTITISNPNPDAVTLNSITDTLPAGFAYVLGSTQGVTTSNPTGTQSLTWTGPFTVPANGMVTLSFDVTVSSTPGDYFNEAGGTAANGYTVLGTGPTAKITVTAVVASADLSITKTDSPDPVTVGDELTYTLLVSNLGPNAAAGVTVSDTLPSGVTFGSATSTQGTCSGTATISCDIGSLAFQGSATVTIKVTPTAQGTLTNTATVSSSTADPVATNNTAMETTTVNPRPLSADLAITKGDSPDPVTVGDELTYTLVVSNLGPDTASAVTVTDTLPSGVNFGSATSTQGTCTGTNASVSCTLGAMAFQGSATVTIKVTPTAQGTLTNTAMVSSSTADPVGTNNTDIETTTVNAPAGPMCNGLPATFVGDATRDTYFQGGPGVDVVVDLGGNNYIQTGGGDDHVCLGNGHDEVDSGDGNDFVNAGGGNNKVKTGNGNDTVVTGAGNDEIDTGNGMDSVNDAGGKNKIATGNEPDQVIAGSGDDEIDSGDGGDTIAAGDGKNEVKAGNGDDAITAGAGDDKIDGGNGFDTCTPGGGRNEVKDCESVIL